MHLRILGPFLRQQFLYRLHDPEPHGPALHIARLHQFVGPHGGVDRRVLAMLLDKLVGGSVDVEVGGHSSIGELTLLGQGSDVRFGSQADVKRHPSRCLLSGVKRT